LKSLTLFIACFYIFIFGAYGQTSGTLPWKEALSKISASKAIKIYYSEDLKQINEVVLNTEQADLFGSVNTELEKIGLTLISYSDKQWVVVSQEDANISLAQWKNKERLIEDQKALEASETIFKIGDVANASNKKMVMVKGVITDELNNVPQIGATIEVDHGSDGTATDENGNYELSLPLGQNQLIVKSLGMVPRAIDILVYSDGNFNFTLQEESINLAEVVVTERAKDENIKRVQMGVEQLAIREIKKLPSFMGELDVVKSLLSLPGVSTAGEGIGGLNIRGGNTDQNLYLQDDIMYFNVSHALGFFSLFHPDLVESVKLYKGNIPAKYGGRLSSVLQTTSVTGNQKNWSIKGGVGLASSKISVDGPIIKDKLTLSFGARLSTVNWLLGLVQVPDVQSSKVNFYDMQGKLTYWLNSNSTMGVQVYHGEDAFKFGNNFKFDYRTQAVSAYYKTVFSANKYLNVRVVSGKYDSNLNDLLPANSSIFNSGVNYLSGKVDLTIEKSKDKSLNFGIETIRYDLNPGAILPGASDSEIDTRILNNENGIEMGLYGDATMPVTDKMTISAGLRLSGFGLLGEKTLRTYSTDSYFPENALTSMDAIGKGKLGSTYFGWEPRFSLNFETSESSSVKASFNRSYQYLSQISNSVAASPIDYWKLADNNIKPQNAQTVSLGYYKNFKKNVWETSVEVYYRDIKNVNDYRDFADLLANETLEQELLIGRGKNYGIELSVKKTIGKLTTRIGYTHARSLKKMKFDDASYTLNQGNWYASNFDKPHDLQVLFNVSPSQRYSFNVNFNMGTGRPVSAPAGKYNDWNGVGIPIYGERNNYRLPVYHRMDLSLNIFPNYRTDRKLKGSWTLGLYNLYFRKNAYSVNYRQDSAGGTVRAFKLSVLGTVFPSITYNFSIQ